jgi:hypothetical protein
MTKSNECLSQILQSKAYCFDFQNRELDNVVYQKHQAEKFKSKIFTQIHKIILYRQNDE